LSQRVSRLALQHESQASSSQAPQLSCGTKRGRAAARDEQGAESGGGGSGDNNDNDKDEASTPARPDTHPGKRAHQHDSEPPLTAAQQWPLLSRLCTGLLCSGLGQPQPQPLRGLTNGQKTDDTVILFLEKAAAGEQQQQ
jgi:hypothetical protein